MFTIQNHTHDFSGPKFKWTVIYLPNQWCNKLQDKQRDTSKLGNQCFLVELHENTYGRVNYGSNNTLAVHLLSRLSQPLSSCHHWIKIKVPSKVAWFLLRTCHPFEYAIFVHLLTYYIGLCYDCITITNNCMGTKTVHSPLFYFNNTSLLHYTFFTMHDLLLW